ncbi:hypothetical protein EsH8_III_000266 [Colletotrichum jinshuiense]
MKASTSLLMAIAATLSLAFPPSPTTYWAAETSLAATRATTVTANSNTTTPNVHKDAVPFWGFKNSCTDIHGDETEAAIWACCDTTHGYAVQNRFRLGQCMENARGHLVARRNGGFWRTCEDCGLKDPERSTLYSCKCWPMPRHGAKPELVDTEIDLNDFIGNDHGALVCFGVMEPRQYGNCTADFDWSN